MPTIVQSRNQFQCKHCLRIYDSLQDARVCEDGHDIVYVPIERADLKRFLLYLVTNDKALLSERFLRTIGKYGGMKSE